MKFARKYAGLAVFAIVLMLLSAPVFAHFSVAVPEKTISVPTGGSRDVFLFVTSSFDDSFVLNLIDGKTWTSLGSNLVKVGAGETKEVVFTVSPFINTGLGLYKVSFVAESVTTKDTKSGDLFISVTKGEMVDIEKIVIFGDTQPTGEVLISVNVKNYKLSPANDVVVKTSVSSPSKKIKEYEDTLDRISTGEAVTINKTLLLGAGAEGGTYRIDTTVEEDGTVLSATQTFSVAKKPIIVIETESSPSIFGFTKTVTIRNDGNEIAKNVLVTDHISSLEAVFFSGTEPNEKKDGSYSWILTNVGVGASQTVKYSVDYSPLFLFIIALIILAWFVFFKMRTVRVKKYIMERKDIREGEEFTVGVEVKNAAGRNMDDVVAKDIVPPIFDIKSMQSPQPKKKKTAAGTELTWELKNFRHGEERLFSYKIVPIFGVHGEIRLPRASVTFKWNKRVMENHSTYATIGISTEKNAFQSFKNLRTKNKKR